MKKTLLSLITITFFLCEASFTGGGMAFAFDNGNYTYTIISSSLRTVSIAAKSDATLSGSISLPSSVSYNSNSYSVVAITASGFSGKTDITSITIPNTVTTINNSAFSGCTSIKSVTFSGTSKVATIGDNAFDGCSKLKTCSLPPSLTTIGSYAFRGCAFTSVTIPKNVAQMKTGVYLGCTSLTSVTWNAINCANYAKSGSGPYSFSSPFYYKATNNTVTSIAGQITKITFGSEVEHIPAYLCYYMTNLTEVTIPASVTSLGSGEDKGFGGCANIQKVVWNATNCTSASSPFSGSKINLTSFEFGSNVQNIPASLCSGYNHLTKILLPATVTNIAASAFSGCTALDTIVSFNTTHPTVANANAFNNVSVGCNVVVPNVSEYSGQTGWNHFTTFSTTISGNCGKTTPTEVTWEMDLSNGRLTISGTGTGAMANYTTSNTAPWYAYKSAITNVIIEEGVVEIGNYAFYSLNAMTSITIPTSITKIGEAAFSGCSTTLFTDVIYLGDASRWANITFSGTTAATVNPINYTKSLKNSAGEIMRNITISNSVKNYAFYMNEALESVNFAESGVTNIGESAFYGCNKLTSITIPSSLTSIQKNAFSACSLISSVVWNATHCGDFSWTQNGPTSITTTAPFYGIRTQITSLVFGENVDKIPNYICRGLTGLTSIIIPESVETIGESSFTDCSNLTSVTWNAANCAWNNGSYSPFNSSATKISSFSLGNNVANIPQRLCKGFTLISSITIPTSVTSIGEDAFSGCSNLKYITWNATNCGDFTSSTAPFDPIKTQIRTFTLGNGVQHIPAYLCNGMSSSYLTSITIPSSVTSIGAHALQGCSHISQITWNAANCGDFVVLGSPLYDIRNQITSVTFGNTVEHIPDFLCSQLQNDAFTSISLPSNLISIGSSAFSACNKLTSITIPENVTSIGGSAFNSCDNLKTIIWNARECEDFIYESGNPGTYYTPFHGIPPSSSNYGNPNNTAKYVTSFTFGSNVEYIPAYLCFDMKLLTGITIPASVTSIGASVFDGCTNLASVTCEGTIPATIASSTFPSSVESAATLYVPATVASRTAYSNDTYWREFDHILPYVLTFDLQEHGETIDPICVNAGRVEEALKPADPTEDYYTFDGWFSNEACTTPFTFGESGTVVNSDLTLFAKWTLKGLALNENADNISAISAYDGLTTNVTMTRSLTNAQYNTFCLPFSLDASQMTTAFGAGYDLEELTDVTYDGEVLGLVFTQRDELEAGKPYLLQPANNVSNPSFTGVEIDASTPSDGLDNTFIEFHGVYSPTELTGGNKNLLFLGAGNELFWPSSTGDLKGFRAYFEVKGSAQKAVRARIVKKEDTATGIDQITNDQLPITNKFLRNGELLILRDGKTYNAQGMLVE